MIVKPNRDRRTERHEAIRREILDAAWDAAHETSIAGLTLRDIATRVGMQQPSLYSHFASKQAIYDAMFQQAWQACLEADPTCEEAASSLMRLHAAHNRRPQALAVYERCAAALGRLGLKSSPALEELRASVDYARSPGRPAPAAGQGAPTAHRGEERRLLSVAVVELSPVGLGIQADPEDVREINGVGLAQAISEIEALGGTVASISGSSMTVLFGAPQSHEDDPERALRVALRMVTAVGSARGLDGLGPLKAGRAGPGVALSVRIGVETGVAVVGPAGGGDGAGYQAVGGVVGALLGLGVGTVAGVGIVFLLLVVVFSASLPHFPRN